ncbi:MAG: MarR family transcriptional regulator [Methanocorpusculum sp.]|nr:MarR family transcriptional regulator [Methanocorpusculum parvum]MBQ2772556.1 MarR family transcriptional regulator [Methanocorpusculum sp.]MBQ4134287.1 MarR family transcriptional regulator [Methanocorpusculum sp.]HJJ52470.1 MarR family transcriptional regulator [Methanocorpusculum sp.]HJJ74995.1 MarR family transcriptional regulator [Methanocorpusculum sp.]
MTSAEIGKTIKLLSNYLNRRLLQIPAIKNQQDITPVQGMILGFIVEEESDIFQKDIEQTFTLRRSTVSGVLSSMEEAGLIIRERVESDARLRKITATEKGKKQHSLIKSELSAIEYQITAGLSDEEITAFLHTAEKIKRNLLQ